MQQTPGAGAVCSPTLSANRYFSPMTSISRLLETALYVEDLERSARFYERVLGFVPIVGTALEMEAQSRVLRPLHILGVCLLMKSSDERPPVDESLRDS
jgi:catechol 2,3-dioxygenase-like lactoylglutathione lyase family enzyme